MFSESRYSAEVDGWHYVVRIKTFENGNATVEQLDLYAEPGKPPLRFPGFNEGKFSSLEEALEYARTFAREQANGLSQS